MISAHWTTLSESPLPHGEFGLGAPTRTTTTREAAAATVSRDDKCRQTQGQREEAGRTTHTAAMQTNLMWAATKALWLFSPHTHTWTYVTQILSLSCRQTNDDADDGDCDVGSQHNTIYRCQSYRTHTRQYLRFTFTFAEGSRICGTVGRSRAQCANIKGIECEVFKRML